MTSSRFRGCSDVIMDSVSSIIIPGGVSFAGLVDRTHKFRSAVVICNVTSLLYVTLREMCQNLSMS